MKKLTTFLIVITMFSGCGDRAFPNYTTPDVENSELVIDLDALSLEINTDLKSYTFIQKDLSGESTEGGDIIYFLKENDLKKIVATYYGEGGKTTYELYYKNQKPFFVLRKIDQYNRPIYWNEELAKENSDNEIFDPSKTITTEEKFYFADTQLILWQSETKELITDGEDFKKWEDKILNNNQKYLNILGDAKNNEKPKIEESVKPSSNNSEKQKPTEILLEEETALAQENDVQDLVDYSEIISGYLNMYYYADPSENFEAHAAMDIKPWIEWGLSAQDPTTKEQRIKAMAQSDWGRNALDYLGYTY